tara:strand:+ start:401 stop:649 length:249 start_codon:yes stop_codon:yes gene_type:complete
MPKKRTYKAWGKFDDIELIDLRRNEVPIKEIAAILGRTDSAIHNRIAILRVGTKDKIKLSLEPEQKFFDKYIKWVDRILFRR